VGAGVSYDNRRNGPMHGWFSLSYASYLVVPRSVIQSMPVEWQERCVALLEELNESHGSHLHGDYAVNLRGSGGRFQQDPLADYRHAPVLRPDESAA
jgi:hypothetical protein